MKKFLSIYPMLLLFVCSLSCEGQNKTDLPQEKPKQEKATQKEASVADVDPYFADTKAISSIYGPQSITRNMIQDRQGYIWLTTWEGIIRYDGHSFVNFTNKEGLKRFHVFALMEDSKGNLWFGTIGAGVYRYDGKSFTHFSTEDGLVGDRVGCFYEDKTGNIWIGTDAGISLYDGKSFRNFTTADGMTDNDVNAIIEDENGKFWIVTRGEACFYDGKSFTKITNDLGATFTNARSVIKDNKGNIWLGGNDGLWRYDGSSYVNYTTDFVGYIYEDSHGDIWTTSQSPKNRQRWVISRYNSTPLPYQTPSATQIKEEGGLFFGILEDTDGGMWFGTLNGVCRYNESTFNFNCFRDPMKKQED